MEKEKISIEITKKDKIYLSVIFALLITIVCLAICLPRPYKFVEKEVVVYEPKNIKVYETEHYYLISPTNTLYDEDKGCYQDLDGNKYVIGLNEFYVETGSLESVNASIIIDENGQDSKNTILLNDAMVDLFVFDQSKFGFGVELNLDYYIMQNIRALFVTKLGETRVGKLENYLLEFKFKNAQINIIVTFLSE